MPTTLYRDASGTLPHENLNSLPFRISGVPGKWSGRDRATRLVDVIIAWNVFQHFYPNFDYLQLDWNAELDAALKQAAIATDELSFRDVLRRFVATLRDGHGWVSLGTQQK